MTRIGIFLLILGCFALMAQDWVNFGPATQSPAAIEFKPGSSDTIYAGSGASLAMSTDGGEGWKVIYTFEQNTDFTVNSILFSPDDDQTFFLGGGIVYNPNDAINGVYKTTDGGNTFTQLLSAPTEGVQMHPADSDIMVAYEDDEVNRTTDGGATWTTIGAGSIALVRNVALDPFDTETLYASTFTGVQKSTDGGATWAPSGFAGEEIILMATHPDIPDKVYCGSGFFTDPEKFYVSTDAGATWTDIPLPYQDFVADHPRKLVFGTDSNVMWMGETNEIFYSGDGGSSWTSTRFVEPQFFYTLDMAVDPNDGSRLLASSDTKGLQTSDAGANWDPFALPLEEVLALAIVENGADYHLYAGTFVGNLRYDSDTDSWEDYTRPGFIGIEVHALGTDPTAPEVLLIGQSNAFGKTYMYKSTDFGASSSLVWNNNSLTGGSPAAFKNDPLNPGHFYFATFDNLTPGQMIKSTDYGDSWSVVTGGQFTYTDIAVDFNNNGTVYSSGDALVFKSTDGGATFNSASSGLPAAYGLYCIDISPFDSNILMTSNDLGLYRTTDAGASWQQIIAGEDCRNIEFSKTNPGVAVIVTWDNEVQITYDDGDTWEDISTNLPGIDLRDARFTPDGQSLFVSTFGQSIYQSDLNLPSNLACELKLTSTSGGGTFDYGFKISNVGADADTVDVWMHIAGPNGYQDAIFTRPNRAIPAGGTIPRSGQYTISSAATGNYIISINAGTYPNDASIRCVVTYQKTVAGLASEIVQASLIPETTEVLQNYPNPFNPSTMISMQLADPSNVTLLVYDVNGQLVKSLVTGQSTAAGTYQYTWDGTNNAGSQVASGVYYYQFIARPHANDKAEVVQTRNMILMR